MKKSEKFLSVLLAVCMILAVSAPAFAAEAGAVSEQAPATLVQYRFNNDDWTYVSSPVAVKSLDAKDAPATCIYEEMGPIQSRPSPRASDLIVDTTLSDIETSRGSGFTSFSIASTKPYYRISVSNTSKETLHFSMTFKTADSTSFYDKDIPAGGSYTGVWTANDFGKFFANFTSNPSGSNLSGTLSVRVSSNIKDLQ